VLLVSRNESLLESLREMLLSWGMSLGEASTPQNGMAMLVEAQSRAMPFHAVLLDPDQDEMSPTEFADAVKRTCQAFIKYMPRLVLLIHPDEYYAPGELRDMGYEGCVAKPPRSSDLYNRLTAPAFGPGRAMRQEPGTPSLPMLGRKRDGSKPHFLVADDNEINRRLATIILMDMGGIVDQARDGIEAVTLAGRHQYDLVFMDVHMPLMDGVSATQHIRASEGGSRRTPIVALTANALKGDMERYLAAGMDGYLSKPLKETALREIILQWCDLGPVGNDVAVLETAREQDAVRSQDELAVIDERSGVELARGKRDLWLKVLGMLLAELPSALNDIMRAAQEGELAETYRLAHKLSGSASYCGVPSLLEASRALETAAKLGETDRLPALAGKLEQEASRLRSAASRLGGGTA
jgi:CheY-like chemotaxis protein